VKKKKKRRRMLQLEEEEKSHSEKLLPENMKCILESVCSRKLILENIF